METQNKNANMLVALCRKPRTVQGLRYHFRMNDLAGSPAMSTEGLGLYATTPYICAYRSAYQACEQVVGPAERVRAPVYWQLIEKGFRRSGATLYRPRCDPCQACKPLRVDVNAFTPNRSQRRAIKLHSALQVRLMPLELQPEHLALYQLYQQTRHADGGTSGVHAQQYRDHILASCVDSMLAEFRSQSGELKMVALIDRLPQALSAVYTFYADDPGASFGTYAILWQITQARHWKLPHVHLGYWVAENAKMHYKTCFQPCEVLHNGHWQQLTASNLHHPRSPAE